jgi:transmembrane sensor
MEETRLRYLYQRFNERTASDAEVEAFHQALSDPAAEQLIKSIIEDTWEGMSTWNTSEVSEYKAKEIYSLITAEIPAVPKTQKLWPRIVAVAAMVAMVVFGIWFFTNEIPSPRKDSPHPGVVTNDIRPGKHTATLTLANGKTIQLSDAKTGLIVGEQLTYNDKTEIDSSLRFSRNNSEVQILTASTPRGGTYQVTLPDGTEVWLNADSKISFPSRFTGAKRRITLQGEAYFQVAENKSHPFIVESKGQQVEVHGTHFNINAYEDEARTKTTLLEGEVSVSSGSQQPVTLYPGQQAISEAGMIRVTKADADVDVAWKNGLFAFRNENIQSIMRKVSRWYNVDVEFKDENILNKNFGGTFSKFENVSEMLHVMELTGVIHFKIDGRRIIVMK